MENAYDINGATGELIVRQLTQHEETVRENLQSKLTSLSAAQNTLAAAKASAKAKLVALGLTDAEITALLGV